MLMLFPSIALLAPSVSQTSTSCATWGALQTALDHTNASGSYWLTESFTMEGRGPSSATNSITLTGGNVKILGGGAVLDAQKNGQLFNIYAGASLDLIDMTLQGGNTNVSGCGWPSRNSYI